MTAEADPITTEVVRNFVTSCAEDMNAALWRSAYSAVIYEGRDSAVALLDADGNMLGQSYRRSAVRRGDRRLRAPCARLLRRGHGSRRYFHNERQLHAGHPSARHNGCRPCVPRRRTRRIRRSEGALERHRSDRSGFHHGFDEHLPRRIAPRPDQDRKARRPDQGMVRSSCD